MWIGSAIRGAAWRRPTGGAWDRAKAGAGMIGSGTNPNRPRTCGSMSLTAKREASYKPAPWKSWPPVRCLPPPSKRIGWRKRWGGVELGDERLNQRVRQMLTARWERPQNSFYRSFEGAGSAKGAYQLVENPRCEINLASMLARLISQRGFYTN